MSSDEDIGPRRGRGRVRPSTAVGILLVVFLAGNPPLVAQGLPLAVSAGAHALTVPWRPGAMGHRFNPAFLVGTERTLREGGGWRLYQTGNLGFFQHYWWMTGVSLDTELGLSRAFPLGLRSDLRLGVGYLHYFWRRRTLEPREGEWGETSGLGRPSLLVPVSLLIGYRRPGDHPPALSPFVSARWAIQVLLIEEAPVMTHLQLLVGVRVFRTSEQSR
jgi:hypothetical protein